MSTFSVVGVRETGLRAVMSVVTIAQPKISVALSLKWCLGRRMVEEIRPGDLHVLREAAMLKWHITTQLPFQILTIIEIMLNALTTRSLS